MTELAGLFEFLTVKRTTMLGNPKNIVAAIFSAEDQAAGDPVDLNTDESEPAEWWQHYGFASRPPKGAQAFVVRAGSTLAAIASRALAAVKVFGKLSEGDVAIYSSGGNVLRLNADRTVSLLIPVDGSDKQMIAHWSPKDGGSCKLFIPNGPVAEFSAKNGIVLNAGERELTLVSNKKVQVVAPEMIDLVGTHKLHVGAAKPMVGVGVLTPGAPNVSI